VGLAERVVVSGHGGVGAGDTPDRLKALHAADRMALGFDGPAQAETAAREVADAQPAARVAQEGDRVVVELAGGTSVVPGLIEHLRRIDVPVRTAEVARPTLDDVFLNLTGRSLREGHGAAPESTVHEEVFA
jgi:ABC-2 type transport system ATP-binding protein